MAVVRDYRALLSGYSWGGQNVKNTPAVITYSFETMAQPYLKSEGGYSSAAVASFKALSASEKAIAEQELKDWAKVAGVKFVKVAAGEGDIRFGKLDFNKTDSAGFWGFAYYPGRFPTATSSFGSQLGGDIFFNIKTGFNAATVSHEIGHALGLKHPFEGSTTLARDLDYRKNTVMSYTGQGGDKPGYLDIDAAKYIYGGVTPAAGTLLSYSYSIATSTLVQKWGDKSNHIGGSSSKDLIDGGAGNDTISGYAKNDILRGGQGKDLIFGNEGNDTVSGGVGNDTMYGGNYHGDTTGGIDTADYSAAKMAITITPVGYWVGATESTATGADIGTDRLFDFEHFIGGSGNDTITGNGTNNSIAGGGGEDLLDGGQGKDTLNGGAGGDTFIYNDMSGQDRISSFQNDLDTLRLDDALWSGAGTLTVDQVLAAYCTVSSGNLVMNFGGGDVLTIAGLTNASLLGNDIEIV